jgi:hypothetical protein
MFANLKIGYDSENKVPTLGFDDMKIQYFKFDLVSERATFGMKVIEFVANSLKA